MKKYYNLLSNLAFVRPKFMIHLEFAAQGELPYVYIDHLGISLFVRP